MLVRPSLSHPLLPLFIIEQHHRHCNQVFLNVSHEIFTNTSHPRKAALFNSWRYMATEGENNCEANRFAFADFIPTGWRRRRKNIAEVESIQGLN
ncbi:hypothetical protein PROFUN_15193 [Planoprotostelium fungivorum]|uniref:Uncharacterized protein n=1 Tax=Planoprotostelium fungivorum TaxID=1890364 RepID=A0A2P6MXL7_9EUKA|nr:hypothetical protein PROFUN_15193 [Planoprotostelium fungivorum]